MSSNFYFHTRDHLPHTLPFLLHLVIEIPASLNFFFRPFNQLAAPAPQARAIIRQYSILLLSSNLIALIFAARPVDGVSRNVAGALAVYHLAPLARAVGRIWEGGDNSQSQYGRGLGEPVLHAILHAIALAGLGGLFMKGV